MKNPTLPAQVFILAALLAATLPSWSQSGPLSPKRVAYLSTLPESGAASRIAAIAKRVEARWPTDARPGAAPVEFRTFRYELPATAKATAAESDADHARRNEEIRARNDRRVAEMLAWKPDVIFAPGAIPAKAAAKATPVIPIVFGCKCNPLPDGWDLVPNPDHPERKNLTGFTRYHLDMLARDPASRLNLHRKRIEILKLASATPVRRVGAVYGDSYDEEKWGYEEAARKLGVEWVKIRLTEGSIEDLPALLREHRVEAGLVLADTFLDKFTGRLVKAAAATPLPVIFPWDEADIGAWMHYGTVVDIPDKAAEYIVNILRGRKVVDYPVEFPKQMELVVNFGTAKAHKWVFPKDFLLQVDRSIE